MDPLRDWSGLVPELLGEIATSIPLVEDFMAFRGVCSSWRAAATKSKFVSSSCSKIPLLMLSETEEIVDYREFYSLSKGKIAMRLPLSELKDRFCLEAGFGWFLTVTNSGDVNLLNPFTRDQIQLPNFTTFPEYENGAPPQFEYSFIRKGVLSANPSQSPLDFILMVIHSTGNCLGCWKPGELTWSMIEPRGGTFYGLHHYNGRFYSIDSVGNVWVWDGSGSACFLFGIDDYTYFKCNRSYLVESSKGELLVVTRDGIYSEHANCHSEEPDDEQQQPPNNENDEEVPFYYEYHCKCDDYGVTTFKVIRLDTIKREWEEIHSLGDDAIFVGHSVCLSVRAPEFLDAIKPNCIYFSDDCIGGYLFTTSGGGKDMGIYNVEDSSIERFRDIKSFSSICPPVWINLSS